ncbi:hypothetical protein [Paenibacillus alvei]|uniref:Uncharacterized protein n=1 Tax=Paenibacillus alvei TaxID=44250 RepID=A0AAP7DHQ4_PAEAL|nr:hypothetical protein [Paenibacillus alvei]
MSSSHRALHRIFLGILSGLCSGGFLILPSREMAKLLTNRVGNYPELIPYFDVWNPLGNHLDDGIIEILVIEHEGDR